MDNMRTSHPARAKPLTGFKPAHRSFAEISLNHLATEAEGGERENTNKNLSLTMKQTPLTMSNLS